MSSLYARRRGVHANAREGMANGAEYAECGRIVLVYEACVGMEDGVRRNIGGPEELYACDGR